jgi:hypothetical protein
LSDLYIRRAPAATVNLQEERYDDRKREAPGADKYGRRRVVVGVSYPSSHPRQPHQPSYKGRRSSKPTVAQHRKKQARKVKSSPQGDPKIAKVLPLTIILQPQRAEQSMGRGRSMRGGPCAKACVHMPCNSTPVSGLSRPPPHVRPRARARAFTHTK